MESRHHLWWVRRDYKTSLEKRLRSNPHFIVYTDVPTHRELHANLLPPPKPSPDLIYGILETVGEYERPLLGVFATVQFLQEQDTKESHRIANHLERQLGHLTIGVEI